MFAEKRISAQSPGRERAEGKKGTRQGFQVCLATKRKKSGVIKLYRLGQGRFATGERVREKGCAKGEGWNSTSKNRY